MEADALRDKEIRIAEGKAQAVEIVNAALEKAQSNPLYLEIQRLEVIGRQITQWDGKYPVWFMGGGAQPNLLIQVPEPAK